MEYYGAFTMWYSVGVVVVVAVCKGLKMDVEIGTGNNLVVVYTEHQLCGERQVRW